jgi:hypothetical protein
MLSQSPPPDPRPVEWRALTAWCLRHPMRDRLTEWERYSFLPSLSTYRQISSKQSATLLAIAAKLGIPA